MFIKYTTNIVKVSLYSKKDNLLMFYNNISIIENQPFS